MTTNTRSELARIKPTFIVCLILALAFLQCDTKEVDSFNLLLPTAYHQSRGHARQLIVTEGDCYQWDSTDAAVVSVKGTQQGSKKDSSNQCHSNGIVQLMHMGAYPSSIYITATDRETNELTNIPVRIRDLERISIFTKSRVMNIREIQNLEVYGFDKENNTFTSLEGLRFKWTVE